MCGMYVYSIWYIFDNYKQCVECKSILSGISMITIKSLPLLYLVSLPLCIQSSNTFMKIFYGKCYGMAQKFPWHECFMEWINMIDKVYIVGPLKDNFRSGSSSIIHFVDTIHTYKFVFVFIWSLIYFIYLSMCIYSSIYLSSYITIYIYLSIKPFSPLSIIYIILFSNPLLWSIRSCFVKSA